MQKLGANLWPLLFVHLLCDVLVFVLHRLSQRATNQAAISFLGGGITPEALGNLWWLSSNPSIANFSTGYQFLTIAVFLLVFPLNVLLKSTASIYTVLICQQDAGKELRRPWWGALGALRDSLPILRSLGGRLRQAWRRVYVVELMVAAAVVPLQFVSLAVVTLPLTLPLILGMQAAGPASLIEGVSGWAAIQRSWRLVRPIRWQLAAPFVGVVVALRGLDAAKGFILTHVPPRYYQELIEIPVAVAVLGTLGSVLLARLQDILPFVAYQEAVAQQAQKAGLPGEARAA